MKIKINLIFVLSLLLIGCTNTRKNVATQIQRKMELMVLSNYGAQEKLVSDNPTVEEIIKTMNEINWNNFHQVVLSTDNNNWIEVSGKLNDDGLSSMYEENGQQFVINEPPSSVEHMTEILVSYFDGDGKFKIVNRFE